MGNSLDELGVNPQTDQVYAGTGFNSGPLTVVNAATPSNPTIAATISQGSGVTVNPVTNRFYTSDLAGHVLVYDGTTNAQIDSVFVGFLPGRFDVNPNTNLIYVYAQGGGGNDPAFVINGANDSVVAGPLGTGNVANQIHVNTGTGYFYANHNTGTMVFDPSYNTVADLSGLDVVGMNSATNRVYMTDSSGNLDVLDGTSLATIATIPGAGHTGSVAADTTLNRFYVADSTNNLIWTIDGSNNTVLNTFSLPNSATPDQLAVDSTKDRIYVAANENGTPTLFVLQDTAVSATLKGGNLVVTGSAGNDTISVDPVSGNPSMLQVTGDGVAVGTFQASAITGHIIENGLAGNDSLRVNPSITINAELIGGAGDDTLVGGGGHDTLLGGAGNDTFKIGASLGPTIVNGGSGLNTVISANKADFTLTNSQLTRSDGGTFTLSHIQNASLTSAGGNHTFTISGWTGTATLTGGSGTNTVVDVADAKTFTLTDSALSVSGRGTITLAGIKRAILIGGTNTTKINASGFSGTTVLDGGGGMATITGGSGRNILIGGTGQATLIGGAASDLLIGDGTSYDSGTTANITALEAIMAEWASSDRYATRISDLLGTTSGGLNGSNFLNSTTVFNAHVNDRMTGRQGLDWFFSSSGDIITDLNSSETVTTI
jgi:Ca2+-binding RTX toxin-like protein